MADQCMTLNSTPHSHHHGCYLWMRGKGGFRFNGLLRHVVDILKNDMGHIINYHIIVGVQYCRPGTLSKVL